MNTKSQKITKTFKCFIYIKYSKPSAAEYLILLKSGIKLFQTVYFSVKITYLVDFRKS